MQSFRRALPGDAQMFWIRPSGRLADVSESAAQALGYSRQALRDLAVWDVDPESPSEVWRRHWKKLRRTGSLHFETTHRHRDGSSTRVEVFAQLCELDGRYYNCALVYPLTAERLAEKSLRESQERLELALAVSSQGLYDLDLTTGRGIVNDAFARMLGYEASELDLTSERWASWLHPDERDWVLGLYRDCLAGRCPAFAAEHRIRTQIGYWLWVRSRAEIVGRDALGQPVRLIGTQLDVSDRKRIELALRESEARFRSIFEYAPLGVALISGAEGTISMANTAYQRLVGYSANELKQLTLADLTHPEDLDEDLAHYHALLRGYLESYHREKRFVRPDGSVVWAEVTVSAIPGEASKPVLALGMVEDMTQRRQAEEALRASELLLHSIIAQSPFATLIFDSTGAVVRRNKVVAELFQVADDAPEWRDYNLFHDEQLIDAGYLERLRRVFALGERIRVQTRYRVGARHRGQASEALRYVDLDSTITPLRDTTGRVTHAVLYHIDITERVAAETRLQHYLSLEQTLAEISGALSRPGWEDLDARIDAALERVGPLVKADCCALLQLGSEADAPNLSHVWCMPGLLPCTVDLQTHWSAIGPALLERLGRDGLAILRRAELPVSDGDDAASSGDLACLAFGWGERLRGFIALSFDEAKPLWPEDDLRFARLIAESIAHSLQHRESEQGLLDHGRFLEDLDRISRILNGRVQDADLMADLTTAILDIFKADRAFFLHPADPDAPTFCIRIEATRPEWPGVFAQADVGSKGVEIEPDPMFRADLRQLLSRPGPLVIQFAERVDGVTMARSHGVQSMLVTLLYPQGDRPWVLGIHQCATARYWTASEQRLFKIIAERAGEALSGHLLLTRIQASEERFARAFRFSPAPTVISSLKEGRIIDVNDRWLEAVGYSREELVGHTFREIDPSISKEARDRVIAELRAKDSLRDLPTNMRCKSGEVLDFLWSAEIIDLDGQPVMLSAFQDVTERKRAEEALRRSEERFAKTFHSSPAPMLVTTLEEGYILDVNERWLILMEAERDALIGRTTREVGVWLDPAERARVIARLRESGPFQNVPLQIRTSKGNLRDILWSTEIITLGTEAVLLSAIHDLTDQKHAERTLQESEQRYRAIFEAAAVAIWEEDIAPVADGIEALQNLGIEDVRGYLQEHPEAVLEIMKRPRIVDVNHRAVRLFGAASKEELLGARDKIRRPETVPAIREVLIAILEGRPWVETEMVVQTLQGERLDVLLSVALPDPEGPFTSLLASMMDITGRKRMEQALRASEARLRAAIESIPFDFFLIDAKGRYLLQNTISQREWGDVIGRCPSEVGADPDLVAQWQSNNRRAAAGEVIDEEVRFVRDGQERFVRNVMAPVNEGGAVRGLVGLNIDITERKRAERALRLAQVCILRSADALFWITPQGRIAHVNEQACASLDYARDVLLKMAVWEIDPNLTRSGWLKQWKDDQATVKRRFETLHRRRDGTLFPVEIVATYVAYEGEEYSFAFVRDISERKRTEAELTRHREHLEELVKERTVALEAANQHLQQVMNQLVQAEKLAALGSLVAGVAHELNTPLGNARMVASTLDEWLSEAAATLERGELRRSDLIDFFERGREAASLLERNTARAADLIRHFKEVAIDQTSMRRRHFNLSQTLEEVLATLAPTFKRTAHRVEIDIPSELELDSYPGPLEQVIVNLIGNSLTHGFAEMEAGCITIAAESRGGEHILLRYWDDGRGIPEEMYGRIFEPFFTTRLGQGGSGLGLYIVYNLVTSVLGGTIAIDRHSGQGARFVISLPRIAPKSAAGH